MSPNFYLDKEDADNTDCQAMLSNEFSFGIVYSCGGWQVKNEEVL